MHIPNLVKIHWYLLKLLFWKENMDVSQSDNSVKLIVLGFKDTSTLVGHFVSSREREKRDRREEIEDEMTERNRDERGIGMKVKKQKK